MVTTGLSTYTSKDPYAAILLNDEAEEQGYLIAFEFYASKSGSLGVYVKKSKLI